MLYSILITYKEDDFVIQIEAASPSEAIIDGINSHQGKDIRLFSTSKMLELKKQVKNDCDSKSCVPINNLQNVWCDTFLVQGELVQMHVVATIRST